MTYPTTIRVSEHFLLSDFLGCHSVYTKGYRNVWEDESGSKMRELCSLCETVLEPLLSHSPISITYGYISSEMSRQVVTYQNPDKPSYHRFELGAAADIIVHNADAQDCPPALVAAWLSHKFLMSRTITYSESSGICVATNHREIVSGSPRKALYENRFQGKAKAKPLYINYSDNPGTRSKQLAEMRRHYASKPQGEWRGAG